MNRRTPLYDLHCEMGAKLVPFAGWDMPLHYGSQLKEHLQVREDCGVFDVSHMLITDISGNGALAGLQGLLAADPGRLNSIGKALYSPLLNETGGIIDDVIVYRIGNDNYRVISNASTREKVTQWLKSQLDPALVILSERSDLAMMAVQGPKTRERLHPLLPEGLRASAQVLAPFRCQTYDNWMLACSGYTGEDGFEVVLPAADALALWRQIHRADINPIGLGARDTLRLEAGLNLYGAEMNEETTPLEVGLAWTVNWDPLERDFMGRKALEKQGVLGPSFERAGLVFDAQTIPRAGYKIHTSNGVGMITSGSFSPTLGVGIALARLPTDSGTDLQVEIRGKRVTSMRVRPPFVVTGSKASRHV